MAGSGAQALAVRRPRWIADDLILSALVILASALFLVAVLDSGQSTRDAVTVQQLRPAYEGPGTLVGALNGGDAPARALARADLDADGAPDLAVGHAWQGLGIVTIQRGNPDAFAPRRGSVLQRMQQGSDPEAFLGDALAV